ncbi:pyridoxamine 5'-phosphate oxidase [Synechocystis sp. PCC 6803]|nr:pyridoxamine 5'-phosphate oxidase [Synechocystis sp. PCC 6803]AVP89788.1 pyridoxamine 5'-phosphate oxidase [Synechocystis sp. IPPAS B-1465]MCW5241669.1 pyridoxamine 5'-phosphate oxidase [Synechocystis sp. PCC 6803]NHL99456.1 pyridoxamine 5'-phosphate oxidase [Synechocystis sp. PCC 6803]BAA18303.1 pyridoxamine 5'-phosphate oxidase [Synechocystis sp. PCC 6803]
MLTARCEDHQLEDAGFMDGVSLADLRLNYTQGGLIEAEVADHPFAQFHIWLQQAIAAELPEPNAMTLSTLSEEGHPVGRMVLLKGLDERGFVFYTNYDSAKGQQLTAHPWAGLVFWWAALERQVRVDGQVEKIDPAESDAYFQSRPRGSQLGAWASPQSRIVGDRQELEDNLARWEKQYENQSIPRPPHWGGFRVIPHRIEFWQGRPSRLHDRLQFNLLDGQWHRQRLAP